MITTNKAGRIWVNPNIKETSYLNIRLLFKNFMKKKWKNVSSGSGVYNGLKFEDRLCKKHQLEREALLRTKPIKSSPRINILIDTDEKDKGHRRRKSRKKSRVRPKTAKTTRLPRYLQPIHGKAVKDDHYDISNFYYRDMLLVRLKENQRAKILNEKQFTNVFLLRNNDPFWKTLDYLQANVKAQVGLGTPIVIKFYADLNSVHPDHPDRLHYDYTKFGKDEDITNEFVYCLKL